MVVNNNVKSLRKKYKMTQEELANLVGVTRQTIIAIEKNKYVPSLELAFKISHELKTKIQNVFTYK